MFCMKTTIGIRKSSDSIGKTKFARDFFDNKSTVEQENPDVGCNFRDVFKRTLREIFIHAKENGWADSIVNKATPEELKRRTEVFFKEFREIQMEDTIFHDVPEALLGLSSKVGGIVVYSKGELEYQLRKIEKSFIWQKVLQAKEESGRKELFLRKVISGKKEAEIPQIIEEFVNFKGGAGVTVVVYDDLVDNFTKAEKYIEQYENKRGIKVGRLYVWAKCGIVTEGMTPEKEQAQKKGAPEYETIEKLSDLENIINLKKIDISSAVVLLDFDGALSDSRFSRAKQAYIAYSHAMALIKDLVQNYVGWKKGEKNSPEIREQIKKLYSGVSDYWKLTN